MKIFYTVSFVILLICNQKSARIEIPNSEAKVLNLVYEVIDSKKSVKIDSFFHTRYEQKAFNGTVLFAEDGRILYQRAFGYSNIRARDSLDLNTVFQLASISKTFTSLAILMLFEQGDLHLDDPIQKYFPAFPYEGITIRLLLTHRSGLPDYMYFAYQYWSNRRIPLTNDDVLDLMILYRPYLYYRPNKRYNYSNTNYCLLALIIEKVTGMPYAQFMRKRIFEPLYMYDTFVLDYEAQNKKNSFPMAVGYARNGRVAENIFLNGVVGDKSVFSTASDLLKWDQALYQGKLISLFSLTEAFKPAHTDLRAWDNYGFGWRIIENEGEKIVYHTGWWRGFRTCFIRKINERKTIIVLSNTARYFISLRKLVNLL